MSYDPLQILSDRFTTAILAAFPQLAGQRVDAMIAVGKNQKLGDFQSNAAMGLAKTLGSQPRTVAQAILAKLDISDIAEPLSSDSIAGPGFINIKLRTDTVESLLAKINSTQLGIEPVTPRETIVVDLMGVNLAKQVQVWHLRATVIGDALARTFERLGYNVVRQNHVGDWGLQIGMVTDKLLQLSRAGTLNRITLDDLDRLYKAVQKECDADEDGLAAARRWNMGPKIIAELGEQVAGANEAEASAKRTLVALQSGDPVAVAMWERVAKVTMDECLAICARLKANVTAEHTAGESSYRHELGEIVDDLVKKGLAVEDQGALVVRLDDVGIEEPLIVRKSDGGFIYATTDLAAVRRRVQKIGASRVVYAVDARQGKHFQQVFAASRKAGYTKLLDATGKPGHMEARLGHAAFGTMMGEDGRPFKTRSGESVKLADMLDEAVARAQRAVAEKNPDLPAADRTSIAEGIAIAAIKYADLSTERTKDYVFSYDRMMSFEGNTGPYLLYAVVRIRSIFRKAREMFGEAAFAKGSPVRIVAPEEKTLALALLKYPGAVRSVAESLEPHRMCQYLYELAGAFSSFFQNCPVMQAPDDATRLARLGLCSLTERVLVDGLNILGIQTLERM